MIRNIINFYREGFAQMTIGKTLWAVIIVKLAVIFIVVALLLTLVTRLIEKLLNAILLGWLNKLLGFLFAILKYSIILGILAYFFNIINGSGKIVPVHLLDNSVIYGLLCKLNELIFPYLQGFINSF